MYPQYPSALSYRPPWPLLDFRMKKTAAGAAGAAGESCYPYKEKVPIASYPNVKCIYVYIYTCLYRVYYRLF